MNETDLQALYSHVLALSQNIPNTERVDNADATVTMVSPLCGSQVTIDLRLNDGIVSGFGQKVRACTLGAAAASIVGAQVVGRSVEELKQLRTAMRTMLKEDGPPPQGDWKQLSVLQAAQDLVSRHGSIMLIFDALSEAIDEIQGVSTSHPQDNTGKGIPDTLRA